MREDAHGRRSLGLTPRQEQVLALVVRGRRTRDVARALGVSERAVTAHITRLMDAFGVANRAGLIAATVARSERPNGPAVDAIDLERYSDAPFLVAVTVGRRHVFRFVNRMWTRVMHLRAADVIGKTVTEVFPDASAATYAARQRAFRTGQPTTGNAWHYRWTTPDGKKREADLRYIYQPLRGSDGKIEGVLLIATEATD